MKETLVIMGSHPRTRELFDFDRTDCDIWMFNEAISIKESLKAIEKIEDEQERRKALGWYKRRADVIFQMHVPAIWRNPANRNDAGHYEWLKSQKEVQHIYMQYKYEEVPNSVKYPLEEIQAMIGNDKNHFLTSSVPQAMALAAYLGTYKRVEIYGVAMETNTEYQFQREGVSYWYGFLKGRGIDVFFADPTFEAPLYGYEGEVVLPYETFVNRIAELEPEIKRLDAEYQIQANIASKAVDNFLFRDNTAEMQEAINKLLKLSSELGVLGGRSQENEKYKAKADKMREASEGEFIFSRQEFESSAKNLSDMANDYQAQVNALSGQADLVHASIQNSAKNSPKRKKLVEAYRQVMSSYMKSHNQAMIFTGAAQENFMYMAKLDRTIRAAGGSKSEAVLLEAMKAGQNG